MSDKYMENVVNDKAFKLICYLDKLKPLFLYDFGIVDDAVAKFKALFTHNGAGADDFDEYEIPINDVQAFFPTCYKDLGFFVDMLAIKTPLGQVKLPLLDTLTLLVILIQGDVRKKARYIFDWYNVSKSGLLSELEHAVLIMRTAKCLNRVKLAGSIEVTRDDAFHAAFVARIKPRGKDCDILRGLDFNDFCQWIQSSDECLVIFRFFHIFERFVDTATSLRHRADAVHALIKEKFREDDAGDMHVPHRLALSSSMYSHARINVTYRGQSSISIAVPLSDISCDEVYVHLQRVIPCDDPFYTLTEKTDARIFGSRALPPKCCRKYSTSSSYRRIALCHAWKSGDNHLLQVVLDRLQPRSEYIIDCYTNCEHFTEIAAETLPAITDAREGSHLTRIVLLPPTASELYIRQKAQEGDVDSLIYTGTIAPSDDILRSVLPYIDNLICADITKVDSDQILDNLCGAVSAALTSSWRRAVNNFYSHIFSSESAYAALDSDGRYPIGRQAHKQLINFGCMGLWSSPEAREAICGRLKDPDLAGRVSDMFDSIYAKLSQSVGPPTNLYKHGHVRMLFLGDGKSDDGYSLRKAVDAMEDVSFQERNSAMPIHVVLVMPTPYALLQQQLTADDVASEADGVRGKQEILHGEFKESFQNSVSASADSRTEQDSIRVKAVKSPLMTQLINRMFHWMKNEPIRGNRRVTMISAAWKDGINFEIRYKQEAAVAPESITHSIPHECLLACHEDLYLNEEMDDEDLRNLIIDLHGLLPGDQTIVSKPPSQTRAAEFCLRDEEAPTIQTRFEDLKMDQHVKTKLAALQATQNEGVRVTMAPKVVKVTSTSVVATLSAFGHGKVRCTLFELPMHTSRVDAVALMETDKKLLKIIESVSKTCKGKREITLNFQGLQSNCCYCIDIEPLREMPLVAQFRTLPPAISTLSGFIVAGVETSDFMVPTAKLEMLQNYSKGLRPRSLPVYLMHAGKYNDYTTSDKSIPQRYPETLCAIHELGQSANAITNLGLSHQNQEYVEETKFSDRPLSAAREHSAMEKLHIVVHGKFCRIAPKSDGHNDANEMMRAIKYVEETHPNIETITIFMTAAVIPYADRGKAKQRNRWAMTGMHASHSELMEDFIFYMLRWKSQAPPRDVQFITVTPDVPAATVYSIKVTEEAVRRLPGGRFNHELSLRQVLLPHRVAMQAAAEGYYAVFPVKGRLGGIFEFSTVYAENLETFSENFLLRPSNRRYLTESPKRGETLSNNLFYFVDIIIQDEYDDLAVTFDGRPVSRTYTSAVTPQAENIMYVREFVDDLDLVDLVFGPVIGNVTQTSAKITFEVNRPLEKIELVLRFFSDHEESDLTVCKEDLKAYEVVEVELENLSPGTFYDIYIPGLCGDQVLGQIRTLAKNPPYTQVAITGSAPLSHVPLLDEIIDHFRLCQSPDISRMALLIRVSNALYTMGSIAHGLPSATPWGWLSDHLRSPGVSTCAVFHLGNLSLLPHALGRLIKALLELGRRLQLPVVDAKASGAWYFSQFEEVIKDSFRLIFGVPEIRDALCVVSHMPLFTSEYLMPADEESKKVCSSKSDAELLHIIRKIYEANLIKYISTMYNWDHEIGHHTRVWRNKSLAIVVMDIVSGRRKVKKIKGHLKEDKKDPNSFSYGFFDKLQWSILQNISKDKEVSQILIMTQAPIVPLGEVPKRFHPPYDVPKGEMIEWTPTKKDLETFVEYWMQWMAPQTEGGNAKQFNRSVTFISTYDFNCGTVIQNTSNGVKIQQLCVGSFGGHPPGSVAAAKASQKLREVKISGKIGKYRYHHNLSGMEQVTVDSTPNIFESMPAPSIGEDAIRPGFALFKLWYDSWKTVGTWNLVSGPSRLVGGGDVDAAATATLGVGPVLGAPYLEEAIDGSKGMVVPILIEVDRSVHAVVEAVDVFTEQTFTFEFDVIHARRAFVFACGPLPLDSKYRVSWRAGVRNTAQSSFVINTVVNWGESIFPIINDEPLMNGEAMHADFLENLMYRCRVPFSGITTVVHLNTRPDPTFLNEILCSPKYIREIISVKEARRLTHRFKRYLTELLECIRDRYRDMFTRPSVQALLCYANHLFVRKDIQLLSVRHVADQLRHLKIKKSDIESGLALMNRVVADISDEYINQLVQFQFRKGQSKGGSQPSNLSFEENNFDIPKDQIEIMYQHWVDGGSQEFTSDPWVPWLSPNGSASVEMFEGLNAENVEEFNMRIDSAPMENGCRIVVLDMADEEAKTLVESSNDTNYIKFQKKLVDWTRESAGRSVNIILPSTQFGTMKQMLPYVDREVSPFVCPIDSVYRSNAKDMEQTLLETQVKIQNMERAKNADSVSGRGKAAMAKKKAAEEEMLRQNEAEIKALFSGLKKDGYFILECRTSVMEAVDGTCDVISMVQERFVSSTLPGIDKDPEPTLFDYIQLPIWFAKFCPAMPGTCMQDEVYLIIRQAENFQAAIRYVESNESQLAFMKMYENSRIAELSKPEDVREVDAALPGVIPSMMKDVMDHIWRSVIPADVKSFMTNPTDEFIRSFLLARVYDPQNDASDITSAYTFSRMAQEFYYQCIAMRMAILMSRNKAYAHILHADDRATRAANQLAERDRDLYHYHIKQKIMRAENYNADAVTSKFEAEFEAKLVKMAAKRKELWGTSQSLEQATEEIGDVDNADEESDLGDLLEEQVAWIEAQEAIEDAKEMQLRLQDLEATEKEEADTFQEKMAEYADDDNPNNKLKRLDKETEYNSFTQSYSKALEEEFSDLIEQGIREFILEGEAEEAIKQSRLVSKSKEERLADSRKHMQRLYQLRLTDRQRIGEKLIFLSTQEFKKSL